MFLTLHNLYSFTLPSIFLIPLINVHKIIIFSILYKNHIPFCYHKIARDIFAKCTQIYEKLQKNKYISIAETRHKNTVLKKRYLRITNW